jgi:hypothetical protein
MHTLVISHVPHISHFTFSFSFSFCGDIAVPEIYFQVFDTCLSRIMEEKRMLHDIAGRTSDVEGALFAKNRARMPIMSTAQLSEISTLMLSKKEEYIPCVRRLVNQCIR